MFELLSSVQSVPLEAESLTTVHRGMNKVRVSVGDHISEPSEVYIITGQSGQDLETYIIFYMLEPGIHLVYGWDANPYEPSAEGQVMDDAVVFAEGMGSILEEIPWKNMDPDQRAAWIEKENLYSFPGGGELEELEDLEELEVVQPDEEEEEPEAENGIEPDPEEDFIEVTEVEFEEAMLSDGEDESLADPLEEDELSADDGGEEVAEPEDEPAEDQAEEEELEDVVVADGDFDELLKQAFLKPDIVEKSRKKHRKPKIPLVREELPEEDAEPDEAMDAFKDTATHETAEEEAPDGDSMEAGAFPEEENAEEKAALEPERAARETDAVTLRDAGSTVQSDTRLLVVRFLSRF